MSKNKSKQKPNKTKPGYVNAPTQGYYLLSAYYDTTLSEEENKIPKKESREPISNRLIYAGKYDKKLHKMHDPVFITDSNGWIHTTAVDEKSYVVTKDSPYIGTSIESVAFKEKAKIIFPPADIVCGYLGQKDWIPNFCEAMQKEVLDSNKDLGVDVELQKVPLSTLRKPKPLIKGEEDKDKEYREWYKSFDSFDRDKTKINTYTIFKTRWIFFIFSLDIIGKETTFEILDGNNNIYTEHITQKPRLGGKSINHIKHIVAISGDDRTLPEGKYTITVFDPIKGKDQKRWNNRIVNSQKNEYTLSFNVKFSFKTLAGEFQFLNADPISLEEAIVQQYPHYYYYLLNEYLSQEHAETATQNSNSLNAAKAIEPYFNKWKLSKEIATLQTDILGLEPKDFSKSNKDKSKKEENDSDSTNNDNTSKSKGEKRIDRLELFLIISEFLHGTFEKSECGALKQSLDLVFQVKSTIEKWDKLRKSFVKLVELIEDVEDLNDKLDMIPAVKRLYKHGFSKALEAGTKVDAKKSIKEFILSKEAWIGSKELDKDFAKTLAHSYGVSQKAWNFVGKSLEVVDVFVSGYEFFEKGKAFFQAADASNEAIADFNDLTQQYLKFLGMDDPILINHNLKVQFDFKADTIKEEFTDELKSVAKLLKDNDAIIILDGHTDAVGSHNFNDDLSLRRAESVKRWLIKNEGIADYRLVTRGWGKRDLKVNTKEKCFANRRVTATIPQHKKLLPANRNGINILEKNRYKTVTLELKFYEATVGLIEAVADFALAIASLIPITAPAALAISLAKSAGDIVKTVDEAIFNNSLSKQMTRLTSGSNTSQDLLFESWTNQSLIRKAISLTANNSLITDVSQLPEHIRSTIQLRLRAEAIGGLLRLIIRASLTTDSTSEFRDKLKKDYKIEAYISNFILSDGWIMPLHPPVVMSMDEFWLYAVNDHSMDPIDARKGFGLNNDGTFINQAGAAISLYGSTLSLGYDYIRSGLNAKQTVAQRMYIMSRIACLPNHVNATFHDQYPIHNVVSENVIDLAIGLDKSFGSLDNKIYEFTGIYVLNDNNKWQSLASVELDHFASNPSFANPIRYVKKAAQEYDDITSATNSVSNFAKASYYKSATINPFADSSYRLYSEKQHSPVRPIKIVIIFKPGEEKNRVNKLTPVSVQLHRYDKRIGGPVYKTIARKITESDISDLDFSQEQIKSITEGKMYGCIIKPFFQIGNVTMAGIKPCAKCQDEIDVNVALGRGEFSRMKYGFTCKVGGNDNTLIKVPMHNKKYWSKKNQTINNFDDEITVNLEWYSAEQRLLFNPSFLSTSSDSPSMKYPLFFRNKKSAEEGTSDWPLEPKYFVRINKKGDFRGSANEDLALKGATPINTLHKNLLTYSKFDWGKTPVEFLITLCCSHPQIHEYKGSEKPIVGKVSGNEQDINSIRCGATLFNTEGWTDEVGPLIDCGFLRLIGKITHFKIAPIDAQKVIDSGIYNYDEFDYIPKETKQKIRDLIYKQEKKRAAFEVNGDEDENESIICYHFSPVGEENCRQEMLPFYKKLCSPPKIRHLKTPYYAKKYSPHDTINGTLGGSHDFIHILSERHFASAFGYEYLFVAYHNVSYKHPLTGKDIYSVKPFGEEESNNYYEYKLDKLITSGHSSGGGELDMKGPTIRLKTSTLMADLKPEASFLNSEKWKSQHKNWKDEIENYINKKFTDTGGPTKLYED